MCLARKAGVRFSLTRQGIDLLSTRSGPPDCFVIVEAMYSRGWENQTLRKPVARTQETDKRKLMLVSQEHKTKLRGLSPRANYTDRAAFGWWRI
jgi:hypothetical protein